MASSLLPILHDAGKQDPANVANALGSLRAGLDRIAAAVRHAEESAPGEAYESTHVAEEPPSVSVTDVPPIEDTLPPPSVPASSSGGSEQLSQIFAQRLFDFTSPLYLVDLDGRLTWCNLPYRQLAERLALRDGVIELQPLAAILAEADDRDRILRREIAVTLDGQSQTLRAHHVPLSDKQGNHSGLAGLIEPVDNTARLTADLAVAQERFDDIVRLTSDWVWEIDAALNIIMLSDRVTKVLGFLPQELVGRQLGSLADSEAGAIAMRQR